MARNILSTAFKRYRHLEINISIIKTMIFNHQYKNEEYPKKIVSIDNTPVKNTTVFKYLSCNISNINTTNHPQEIQNWRYTSIQSNASFMSLGKNDETHEGSRVY